MTPKEKAEELVDKFYQSQVEVLSKNGTAPLDLIEYEISIKSALIAVDEIIKQLTPIEKAPNNKSAFLCWEEVKNEIEKL
jgi:hypothetical protein